MIGRANWEAIASSTEPFFELRLPGGRAGACFISSFDRASTTHPVAIARDRRGTLRLEVVSREPPPLRVGFLTQPR
jgi:hypothetical protein